MASIDNLYFITMDEAPLTHLQQVEAACRAGIRLIQLRMKLADDATFRETARAAKEVCDEWGVRLIINDRVEVAREVGAYGVHLGKQDMSVAEARLILGEDFVIGGTANTIEDIRLHYGQGADYIGLGPYRWTSTKKNLSPILGLAGYQRIVEQMRSERINIPVTAIGGIGEADIRGLWQAGLRSIAFSGALVHSKDWSDTVGRLAAEMQEELVIAGRHFRSRLFTGTGKFGSSAVMEQALLASGSELVTVALKRVDVRKNEEDDILSHLNHRHIHLLPNTSGVRTAKEAVFAAELAREALGTNWLKLEIHPDPRWLMPDPVETLLAAEELVKKGFVVLPYIHADPVLCRRLEEVGVAAVMPLGSPIGSNKGLRTSDFLEIIIAQSKVPVVVDAGIGAPSDAARAMEMGADAVLVNTAIAASAQPVQMARAFRLAVDSGRMAYEARLAQTSVTAVASSPLTAFLDQL
ncbi:MAG TPA: thiamine phosphate synthase [Puia sp.]|nr:thiamine phosphate synthase [Puia sp.]